jgi:hypothetical protein
MKQKLFPNLKKMTTMFCIGIIVITFSTLTMRLTFLNGMAVVPPVTIQDSSIPASNASGLFYQINPKIYFATSESKGNILITNLETNNEYIRVNLTLNDTGRSIYYSGDIAPGTSIASVRLQGAALEEGVYECTATITAYDPQTKDKLGSEDEAVTVYIGVKPDKK